MIFVILATLPFVIGSCWFIILFIKDILNDLTALNRIAKETGTSARELRARFREIVQLYSEAKEFIRQINAIFELLILIIFVYTLLSISTSLFAVVSQMVRVLLELLSHLSKINSNFSKI